MDEEQRIRALLAVKEKDDFDRKILEQQQKKLEDTRQRLEGKLNFPRNFLIFSQKKNLAKLLK